MTAIRGLATGIALGLLLAMAPAWGWQVSSGPQRTVMIELFTSQGCSSCPPAEEFLNRFSDNPRLWRSFVPLAFHVDYWDYLGWQDRYALPDNARRQRRYAALGHVRGVYTPGFMVNGRGWRPGWLAREPGTDGGRAGELTLLLDGDRLEARYGGAGAADGALELHVALLGMGLATDIARGERAGGHSRHDFVVLAHQVLDGAGPAWSGSLPAAGGHHPRRLALAAWVSRPGDPTPLQAAGGFLPVPLSTAADPG